MDEGKAIFEQLTLSDFKKLSSAALSLNILSGQHQVVENALFGQFKHHNSRRKHEN